MKLVLSLSFLYSFSFFSLSSFFVELVGGYLYISVLNSLQSGEATREEEEARVVKQKGEGKKKRSRKERKMCLSSSGLTPRRNQPRGDARGPGQTS